MMRSYKLACLAALLCCAGSAWSADLEVKEPWVRGTVQAQKATGAFMQLSSKQGVTVVGASSPVAGVVEIHEMSMADNMMKMRAVPRLEVPAGKTVELKPGSYHVMLMDLKQELKSGDIVPISLTVLGKGGKQEQVDVKAEVRAMGGGMDHMHMHHH
ncbi:MAG: copper chaperone PCu(A)C [Zoogloea sp.]|nr:copper chaperone PCu(A)C [Zoogloea sp.]